MTRSQYRGHDIFYTNDKWYYSDTKEPVSENKNRSCGYCGKPNTKEGHDPCIGTIPNVLNACCGHGNINEAYIQFLDLNIIRGPFALKILKELKGEII